MAETAPLEDEGVSEAGAKALSAEAKRISKANAAAVHAEAETAPEVAAETATDIWTEVIPEEVEAGIVEAAAAPDETEAAQRPFFLIY